MKLLITRVALRTSTIVDGKRWSNDTLNAGGQKDLSNLMKIKYILFVKSIVILSSGVSGFLLSVSSYAFLLILQLEIGWEWIISIISSIFPCKCVNAKLKKICCASIPMSSDHITDQRENMRKFYEDIYIFLITNIVNILTTKDIINVRLWRRYIPM